MLGKTTDLSNRILSYIQGSMPIVSDNGLTLTIENLKVDIPQSNYDIENQLQMKYSGEGSTEGHVSGTIKITNRAGAKVYSGHYAKLITFPVSTERGTYIVNGIEKNIISQMKMKAGCYTNFANKGVVKTQLRFKRPDNGGSYMPAISFEFDPTTRDFVVIIKGYKEEKFNIVNFLSILGFTDMEIKKSLGDNEIADSIMQLSAKKRSQKTLDQLYKIFFPRTVLGENLNQQQKIASIFEFFQKNALFGDGSVVSATLGVSSNNRYLTKEILSKAVKKTVSVSSGLVKEDIKDEIKFKDVYNDTDLIFESICKGLDNFMTTTLAKMDKYEPGDPAARMLTGLNTTIHAPLTSREGLMSSELCVSSEEINPLFMEAKQRELSQGGQGGMSKDSIRNETDARNLTSSGINKIDPVETPESGKIGITQHLTYGAVIENNTIKSKFLKVLGGKAIVGDSNTIKLDAIQEENAIVAFNDTHYVKRDGNAYVFTQDMVPARYMGKTDMFPVSKIQYLDADPHSLLGTAGNMIPFVGHDDGARALMGAAMQKQSINLVQREAPMVTTLADGATGMTFDQKVGEDFGRPVKAKVSGTVHEITKSKIIIVDNAGKSVEHPYYNYYPLNQSYINNELKVRVGDHVTEGQIIAEGWQTKEGKLALGMNTRIGFMPYKGYNYEDGVVVSESYSKKMTAEEYDEVEILIPKGALGGKGSNIKNELMKYTTNASLNYFDQDGIIKVGETIKAGTALVGFLKEVTKDSEDILDLIARGSGKINYKYSEKSVPAGSYVAGKIERIVVVNNPDATHSQKIVFSIVNKKPLKVGDKIAGRHGNKGTITKILPDKLMPVSQDGVALDLLMSPLAVPSRKNLGQVLETNAGLIAEKTGKPFIVDNFNHEEKDRVLKELKAIGFPEGKMKVTIKEEDDEGNIIDVPVENPITVGNMYVMKLKHKVDDKIQSRSNRETPLTSKTYMPQKVVGTAQGEKSNPQRLGEMEMRALQAHGAAWNILESSTIKADGAGNARGKAAIFKALATGKLDAAELNESATPETVKVLSDSLKVMGLDVKPMYNGVPVEIDKPFNSIGIAPLNQSEFLNTVGHDKEIFKSDILQARQLYGDKNSKTDKDDKVSPDIKGGLLDTDIFGTGREEEDRTKWGYIKLPIPVPNPLFMESSTNNIYETLTGIKKSELKQLVGSSGGTTNTASNGLKAIITDVNDMDEVLSKITDPELVNMYKKQFGQNMIDHDLKPGDIVNVSVLDKLKEEGVNIPYRTGGSALEYLLEKVDVNKSLDEAKAKLEKATKAGEIDKAYKKVRQLEMIKNNNLNPTDLMIKTVPVAPSYLRPITPNEESRSVLVSDLNHLYANVITAKNTAEKEAVLDESGMVSRSSGLAPTDMAQRSKVLYESIKKLHGSGSQKQDLKSVKDSIGGKYGIVRKEMLAKRVDFSGRSVITVNPNLTLDEVGIPMDMAKSMYKPFIMKALVDKGVCANEIEAEDRMGKPDKEVKAVIQEVASDRPLFLNRQPSLHRFSIQAMKPVIKEYEDGGVVRSIQLNPLVVTGFNADFDGDTMATHVPVTEKAKEEAKKLSLPSQNLINPTDGKMIIEIRHEMALGIYQITKSWDKPHGQPISYTTYKELERDYLLGKIPFNQAVKVPLHPQVTTAGQAIFNWLIPDKIAEFRNYRKVWNKKEVSKMLMEVYKKSEEADFKNMSKQEIANLFDRIKDLGFKASTRSGVSLGSSDFVFDEKIQKSINKIMHKGIDNGKTIDAWRDVEKEIEDKLEKGLLPSDNPLQIMMDSGSRANAQQIRKMFATIGVGMDVSKNLLTPIQNSHFDGLSPQEYYELGKDSRKGIYDRSVSTEAPGTLARQVWSATQDVMITEKDCGTKEFINLKKTDATIKGRYAGKDILASDGSTICKRNQMITNAMFERIYKDDTIEYVPVRSTLRCKTPNGKCQHCYGAMAGTLEPAKVGTSIGVIASQAMGEPVTQMTMNTFHTGGANSSATIGLPMVNSILNMGAPAGSEALLATQSGVVTDIIETPTEVNVFIGKKKHVLKKAVGKQTPALKVKKGDMVTKGDFLTAGDTSDIISVMDGGNTTITLTSAKPKELFKEKAEVAGQQEALQYTRDYLTNSMQYAIKGAGSYMDRRHAETIISKLTSEAMVMDAGDSPYMKGQRADVNLYERWNKENCDGKRTKEMNPTDTMNLIGRRICMDLVSGGKVVIKKGTEITQANASVIAKYPSTIKVSLKPIQYQMDMKGQKSSAISPTNWFSNLGAENVGNVLATGAATGAVDHLTDSRSRLMAGKMLNIGEGAELNNEFKDKFPNKMMNFFSNKINIDKYKH